MGPFLYVTALHGNRPTSERPLSLALETGAWLVVNGGDMYSHGRMQEDQAAFLREFLDTHLAKYQAAGIRYFGIPANDDLRAHGARDRAAGGGRSAPRPPPATPRPPPGENPGRGEARSAQALPPGTAASRSRRTAR